MKKLNPKQKKIFLSVVALVLVAAIGVGIWFGAKGSAEPVNVYAFNYLGMTEYWGDNQESYGPVSTDKIQTVYLSDTQTVTEVLVGEGDEVKKGDVLMTFDTTLTELELERKRLEVEKQKLDLKDAQAQLQKIRNMKPMDPDAINFPITDPTEPDLGNLLVGSYQISEDEAYDGSSVEKALICWVKDGQPINDPLLRAVYLQAIAYQRENANKPNSSASAIPDMSNIRMAVLDEDDTPSEPETTQEPPEPTESEATEPTESEPTEPTQSEPTEPTQGEPTEPTQGEQPEPTESEPDDGIDGNDGEVPNSYRITLNITCNGSKVDTWSLDIDENGTVLSNTYKYNNKTYWLQSATHYNGAKLLTLNIPGFPTDPDDQEAWKAVWEDGVTLNYIRSTEIKSDQVVEDTILPLEAGKETSLCFSAFMKDIPAGGTWKWDVTSSEGENVLKATPNGNFLILSGKPEAMEEPVEYTVTVTYAFVNSKGEAYEVKEEFSFSVKAVEKDDLGESRDNFYMILKVTEENRERGARLTWQGLHVFCYDDGSYGMTLFDASSLEDHTLEELEEDDVELPDIDFGSGYTAGEIAKMRADQEKKVKELDLALRMAEAEFKIMQAEVNDGKVCADFDGKVVSVLTEEEARQDKRPLLKVSAGGGFYVEVSVNELEMEKLKIGQEVTINDWNTGMTYTGTVDSIGDFPVSPNGWSSDDNANVTYYPFTVFVDSSADLQAGNYVNVTYSTSESENGVYLQNAFIRTEQGRSYIFVKGEDGKLEKRYVTVGKSLWGSYTQVLSGLTEDDFLAFPYGKTVKEGAPAVESDNLSSLYSY